MRYMLLAMRTIRICEDLETMIVGRKMVYTFLMFAQISKASISPFMSERIIRCKKISVADDKKRSFIGRYNRLRNLEEPTKTSAHVPKQTSFPTQFWQS